MESYAGLEVPIAEEGRYAVFSYVILLWAPKKIMLSSFLFLWLLFMLNV